MQISVKYFARLRELTGEAGATIEVDENTCVDELWRSLGKSKHIELNNVMMTVNMEYVKPGHRLKAGDEVAFFPPVTGG